MSYPQIIENHNEDILDIESRFQQFQENLINLIYPIGSIYMSVNNVSPEIFLGGTWTQIQDTFLLSAGSIYTAGSTGGEANHTLTVAETPAHTHTRGTMNITGTISIEKTAYSAGGCTSSGAFYNAGTSNSSGNNASHSGNSPLWGFDASRSWTGETSSVGSSQSHNNMPPYLTVYMWKRIS